MVLWHHFFSITGKRSKLKVLRHLFGYSLFLTGGSSRVQHVTGVKWEEWVIRRPVGAECVHGRSSRSCHPLGCQFSYFVWDIFARYVPVTLHSKPNQSTRKGKTETKRLTFHTLRLLKQFAHHSTAWDYYWIISMQANFTLTSSLLSKYVFVQKKKDQFNNRGAIFHRKGPVFPPKN